MVFENVNLSAPDVDDYDDNDDDEADDENRAGKRYEIALVMRRVTIFTIPEWLRVSRSTAICLFNNTS